MTKELEDKIHQLFEYRQFPMLYSLAKVSEEEQNNFGKKLFQLQAAIYYLDAYLETHWVLSERELNRKWKLIYDCLERLGVPKTSANDYVKYILKYQKHEIQLREGMMPTRLSMEYYYYYKSCDVKLIRRLIYEKFPILSKWMKLSEWRSFDLITEINDDVEDIFEDIATINGNRFLISAYSMSKTEVCQTFLGFIEEIKLRNKSWNIENKLMKTVKAITDKNISETNLLFSRNFSKFTQMYGVEPLLFHHLEWTNG